MLSVERKAAFKQSAYNLEIQCVMSVAQFYQLIHLWEYFQVYHCGADTAYPYQGACGEGNIKEAMND